MKKRNSISRLITVIVVLLVIIIVGGFLSIKLTLSPVSKESDIVRFEVKENASTKSILKDLKANHLIRNDKIGYYYLRLKNNANFKVGKYDVDRAMDFNEVIAYISDAKNAVKDTVMITFKEGEWLKEYALKLAEETNLSFFV